MSYSTSNNMANATPPRPTTSSSVRKDSGLVLATGNLTLETPSANRIPNSPQALSPSRNQTQWTNSISSPNGKLPPKSPLHRSPSSMSQHSRSSTPTLLRKASMNSLHGVGGITPSRSSSSRRSSSAQYSNASTMVGRSPLSELEDQIPPPPKHTPESIARNHFAAELEAQNSDKGSKTSDTVVILHDSCYGHRFSRPNTSAYDLSTIVERPERINACILGLSMAYVWLGDRHAYGQHSPHPKKDPSEIPEIPFKIQKTARRLPLSAQAVTNVHGVQWMEELKIMCNNAESKLAGNGKELTRPDMHRTSTEKPADFHTGDLYLCPESLNAMEGSLGAVCEGVDSVFQGSASGDGPFRTFVVVRPPGHHCSADYPSGFCWVNNVHVGIQHAALTHGLTHAAIIDFDLHHGDGSQAIAWESNKRAAAAGKNAHQWKKISIGYFSCHDIASYPCELGDVEKVTNASVCIENAHNQSIWNVHLKTWKSEAEFWELYETRYSVLLEKTRNYLRAQTERLRLSPKGPKAKGAIFLSAGFDASEWESSSMQRHPVNVPTEFYARLTRDVVRLAAEEGCAVDGRVISVLEGGYSDRALCTGVLSHLSGMVAGEAVVIKKEPSPNGLGYEMVQKIGAFDGHVKRESVTLGNLTYNPSWWSVQNLEQLDAVVNPSPLAEVRRPKDLTPPTYSSPTQSFIAKVSVTPRRVSSGMSKANASPRAMSRPPSPPPPDVDWTIATHELSKLLIPIDRTTMSYQPEDLAPTAPRVRRERQSVVSSLPSETELSNSLDRMTLRRTRQTAKPLTETAEEHEPSKVISRTTRRRTDIGTVSLIAEQETHERSTPIPVPGPAYSKATAPPNRRASISLVGSVVSEAPVMRGRRVPSSGMSSALTRPGTAQNIRPESSASVRNGATPPISVTRARKPTQPRADAPKVSRPRKKSPLNDSGLSHDQPVKPVVGSSSTLQPGTDTTKMDDMAKDLAGISLAQPSQIKPEKSKPKPRPVTKAPVGRPKKIGKLAETLADVELEGAALKSVSRALVPKESDNNSLTESLGGMAVQNLKPSLVPSSSKQVVIDSSSAPPKKKYTIDMKQLGLRAKGTPKPQSEISTLTPPNFETSTKGVSRGVGNMNLDHPKQQSMEAEEQSMSEHIDPASSAQGEPSFKVEEGISEPVTVALGELDEEDLTSQMANVNLGEQPVKSEESNALTNATLSERDTKPKSKRGSKIATAKPIQIKLNTHNDGTVWNQNLPLEPSPAGINSSPAETSTSESLQLLPAAGVPLPASSPPSPSYKQSTIPRPVANTSDGFIAYKPEGPPASSIGQQEPLRWLAPNTATPSPMKKGELPVFTSTGAIPFAAPTTNGIMKQAKREENVKEVDIYEVPETPRGN